MKKKTFVNEYGRKITISISKYSKNLINVKIKGPKSLSENIITKKEAKILKKML